MEKIISLILLITLSSFLSLALCRTMNDPASAGDKFIHLDISPAAEDITAGIEQSNPRWWFRGGFLPRLPWPLVRQPFTWPQNRPWPHWEFVSPPRIAGGFKWPRWRLVNPPRTWPHWEFVQPPVDAGSHWPPTDWQFVQPPMPSVGDSNPAPDTSAAPPEAV